LLYVHVVCECLITCLFPGPSLTASDSLKYSNAALCLQPGVDICDPKSSKIPWWFDPQDATCQQLKYDGCRLGEKKTFATEASCVSTCVFDRCYLQMDPGNCRAYIQRWGYNVYSGQCEQFIYGGCGGNGNNFYSEQDCLKPCGRARCFLPQDGGADTCYAHSTKTTYYSAFDYHPSICQPMQYNGCFGNANRFTSVDACLSVCTSGA